MTRKEFEMETLRQIRNGVTDIGLDTGIRAARDDGSCVLLTK